MPPFDARAEVGSGVARTPGEDYQRLKRAVAGELLPAAVVDLDAVERNATVILDKLEGTPVALRLATKSIRVPEVLRILLEMGHSRFRGLMTYSAAETLALSEMGFDDLFLAYPIGRAVEAQLLARVVSDGRRLAVVVDAVEQVRLLAEAARSAEVELPVCLDLDASWRPAWGKLHFGVRRSPLRDVHRAVALAEVIERVPGVRLVGLMAYEAQVAGLREHNPTSRQLDPIRRLIKERSVPHVAAFRSEVVAALEARGHAMTLVNGGGTGSLGTTPRDRSVTEVTAGSGFYCPHLFDHYAGLPLVPAAFAALPVTRHSDPDHITCFGGGYVASGPLGEDRMPVVHLPPGLAALDLEGFGEVQTPLRVLDGAAIPGVGDPVFIRHAKAGELMERFSEVLLVRGESVVGRARTYRGHGWSFG